MPEDLAYLSATELVARYAAGDLSPVEATEACLARIEDHGGKLNAFIIVDREGAIASARRSEARWAKGEPAGLVDGVPTGIKDIVLTKGWPTLRGSKTVDVDQAWNEDAPVVARLREQGAVFLGKTTTPEFGWKGVTDSPLCGVTRNPWDPARTSGGSSGGSAVAAAIEAAPVALGTDAGGSIRIPAGFCGVVGLKPSTGEVPHWPAPPYGLLAHAGPMARTVEDCALLLSVLTHPDPRDASAARRAEIDYVERLSRGVGGLRVAYSPNLGYVEVDPEVAAHVARAARAFEDLGAQVEAVDPGFDDPIEAFDRLFFVGAHNAVRHLSDEDRAQLEPALDAVARQYAQTPLDAYLDAERQRQALSVATGTFHEDWDLLLTPTLPLPAFDAGREVPSGRPAERWSSWTPFTYPFNMTGQPALSVPCGLTSKGLPVGLQIVARRYADELVLRAGHAYQSAHPLTNKPPPTFSTD